MQTHLQSDSMRATSAKAAFPSTMLWRIAASFASASSFCSVTVGQRQDDGRREPTCFTRICEARTSDMSVGAGGGAAAGRVHEVSPVLVLKKYGTPGRCGGC